AQINNDPAVRSRAGPRGTTFFAFFPKVMSGCAENSQLQLWRAEQGRGELRAPVRIVACSRNMNEHKICSFVRNFNTFLLAFDWRVRSNRPPSVPAMPRGPPKEACRKSRTMSRTRHWLGAVARRLGTRPERRRTPTTDHLRFRPRMD